MYVVVTFHKVTWLLLTDIWIQMLVITDYAHVLLGYANQRHMDDHLYVFDVQEDYSVDS